VTGVLGSTRDIGAYFLAMLPGPAILGAATSYLDHPSLRKAHGLPAGDDDVIEDFDVDQG
jgi:hypothetical protein